MTKTAFISHPDTLLHMMDGSHPELPACITEFIKKIVKKYAENRIISSLEGGYDLPSSADSALVHIETLGKNG